MQRLLPVIAVMTISKAVSVLVSSDYDTPTVDANTADNEAAGSMSKAHSFSTSATITVTGVSGG